MSSDLFAAAQAGDVQSLKHLIADHEPNETDEAGRTAIFYAQLAGHDAAVALLAEHGWTPMARTNMFEGPGGRLCFWNDPEGVRVRQLRPRPVEERARVNWSGPRKSLAVHAAARPAEASQSEAGAKRPKREPLSHKKEAVAFRKRQRQLEYHRQGSVATAGRDHPLYPRKPYGRPGGPRKPGLRRMREDADERLEEGEGTDTDGEDWEEATGGEELAAPLPPAVTRTGVSEVLAAVQLEQRPSRRPSRHRSSASDAGSEAGSGWVMVPPVPVARRGSSSGSSWQEVDAPGAVGPAEAEDLHGSPRGDVPMPAFDGERRSRVGAK